MWLFAAETPAPDSQTAIILGVIGLLTAVLVAVATGVFSVMSARANRTEPSPPAPVPQPGVDLAFRDYVVGELAVARQRDDDSDERDDMQDRALAHQGDQLDNHEQRLRLLEARDDHEPDGRRT